MEGTLSTNAYLMDYNSNYNGTTNNMLSNASNTSAVSYKRNENLAKIEIAIQAVIFSLAVIGNGLVILILLCSPTKRKKKLSRMNILIFHLSIADLFVAFFNVLPQLIWDVTFIFYGGDFLCRSVKYFQVVAMYASSYVLITTAIDRYIALCHPLVSQRWSNGRVHIMAGIAWLIALIFSTPQVIIFGYREALPGVYTCWAVFDPPWTMQLYITLFTLAIYIIPTLILIFAYGKICYVVWKTTAQQENSFRNKYAKEPISNGYNGTTTNGGTYKMKTSKMGSESQVLVTPRVHVRSLKNSKVKTVKLTLVVIICYFVCWSPFFISQMWAVWDENAPFEATGMVIILLLASLNSCTNPWIYLAFTDNLRQHLLSLFPCQRSSSNTSSRSRYGSSYYYSNSRTEMSKMEVSISEKDNNIPMVRL